MPTKEDRLEAIDEARKALIRAKEEITWAIKGLENEYGYHDYVIASIDNLLGEGNPYDDSITDIENEIKSRED